MNSKPRSTVAPLAARLTCIRSLVWESWRRGAPWCAVALVGVCSLAAIFYNSILRAGPLETAATRPVHLVFLWIEWVAFGMSAYALQRSPVRLYQYPLSTVAIVGWTMFLGAAAAGTLAVLTGIFLNLQFEAGTPVVGPALFLAAALPVVQGVFWGTKHTGWLQPAACAVAVLLLNYWLNARNGGGLLAHSDRLWREVTPLEIASLAGMALAGCAAAYFGLSRDRCGERPLLAWRVSHRVRGERTAAIGRRIPLHSFHSAADAQFWYEWRQSGLLLPRIYLAFLVLLIAGYLGGWFHDFEYELLHLSIAFGCGIGPVAAVVGVFFGLRQRHCGEESGSFLATRPMSSTVMSRVLFKVAAVSWLATWSLWAAGLALSTANLYAVRGAAPVLDLWTQHGNLAALVEKLGYGWGFAAAGLVWLLVWAPLTLGISLALTGRQSLLNGVIVGGLAVLIGFAAVGEMLPEQSSSAFRAQTTGLFGAVAFAGTACLFLSAWRRKLISTGAIAWVIGGWAGLSLSLCLLKSVAGPVPALFVIFVAGVSTLPFTGLAAAPLALSWNRNR